MKNCENCFYWSDLIAQSIGCGDMKSLCFNEQSKYSQKYTKEKNNCNYFKQSINNIRIDSNYLGF